MAEINIDISKLPEDVREKLAELDLELSEGTLEWLGTIDFLIDCGALTNSIADDDVKPMSLAAEAGNIPMIVLLSLRGGDLDNKDCDQAGSALYLSLCAGESEAARVILALGGRLSPEEVQKMAMREGALEEARRLGVELRAKDATGWTALHWAVVAGDFEGLQRLARFGLPLNEGDMWGWTPLHLAVHGSLAMVRELVDLGADVNARDLRGLTPLAKARVNDYPRVAAYLKRKGGHP